MDQKVLDTIKKLLALSTSSNVNEAATAFAHAQRLMTKHRISMLDVENVEDTVIDPLNNEEVESSKSFIPWRTHLIQGIAKANGCHTYLNIVRYPVRTCTVRIVGPSMGASATRYMYAYVGREIERLAGIERTNNAYASRSWLRDFRLGAVYEIVRRIKEASASTIEEEAGSTALARIDSDAERVKKAVAALDLTDGPSTSPVRDGSAFEAGRDAGATVNIDSSAPGLKAGSIADLKDGGR